MSKLDILNRLKQFGAIPIIRFDNCDTILQIAQALIDGGLPVLEISLSIPGSLAFVESVARKFGNKLLLGAGTVLDAEAVKAAHAAGAQYIVSPAVRRDVIDTCKSLSIPVFPGALTPTEIVDAWKSGADAIKVFPCNAMGGMSYIKSLKAPLPNITLFPCGGVGLDNAEEYIKAGAHGLFVGSCVIGNDALNRNDFDSVRKNAAALVSCIANARKKPS